MDRNTQFVLGNPKAWLGIAYHEVMEKLWYTRRPDLDDEQLVDFLWSEVIERIRVTADAHPLNCRFPSPEKWPGYHLAHAFLRLRAGEALAEQPRLRDRGASSSSSRAPAREKELVSKNGKLVGKPDVVVGDEIRDYKSGSVFEKSNDGRQIVKDGYIRQLQIYGYLVEANSGRCPSKGKLLPMQGNPVEIELSSENCSKEAEKAVMLLESLNSAIEAGADGEQLATASEEVCRWCEFKIHCPAFWTEVEAGWWEDFRSAAVMGRLVEPPNIVHNGRAYSLRVDVSASNVDADQLVIGPFDREIHSKISKFEAGEQIRITGLYLRQDGQVSTNVRTVCFRVKDCLMLQSV